MSKANSAPPSWLKTRGIIFMRDAVLVLLFVWAVSSWQTRDMLASDGSVHIPKQTLVSLQGETQQLFTAQGESKPTLVYFFAPWCTVCRYSISNLNDLDTDKVNIVTIALDYTSRESVIDFVTDTQVSAPVMLGTNNIKQAFQVPGYPSYYLLDENNRVVGNAMGYSTEWGMKLQAYLVAR